MRTWKAANPPRDAGRPRALGKPMSNSSFLGLLFYVILSCFAEGAWAVTVVAGGEHTCAILNDGSVKCWGRNHKGQLASGDYTDRSTPTPTDLLPRPVVKLALGHQHTCVVLDDGTARCWGDNLYGQLGNGDDGAADRVPQTPQGFGSTGSVTDIACGEEFTCAIRTDGTVVCWGRGGSGQIGHGAFSDITTPYPTSPTISAIDIALGGKAACALLQDGTVLGKQRLRTARDRRKQRQLFFSADSVIWCTRWESKEYRYVMVSRYETGSRVRDDGER